MGFKTILLRIFGFIFKPIFWVLMFLFNIIKSPYRLGALIVGLSILFGTYSSIQERNLSPLVYYVGSMTLNTGDTISKNLQNLETQNLSLWGKIKTWINILAAIYMFFILVYVFAWIIIQTSGGATPNVTVYSIALIIVLLLSNMFSVLTTGHLSSYFGLGGFIDLFKYLFSHKDFVLNLINTTSYGNSINISSNLTNLTNSTI